MSASNLGNDFFNEEDSPIPIPPAKDGWADMASRLDAIAPPLTGKSTSRVLFKAAVVSGIIAATGAAFALTYYATHPTPTAVSELFFPHASKQKMKQLPLTEMDTLDFIHSLPHRSGEVTDTLQWLHPSLQPQKNAAYHPVPATGNAANNAGGNDAANNAAVAARAAAVPSSAITSRQHPTAVNTPANISRQRATTAHTSPDTTLKQTTAAGSSIGSRKTMAGTTPLPTPVTAIATQVVPAAGKNDIPETSPTRNINTAMQSLPLRSLRSILTAPIPEQVVTRQMKRPRDADPTGWLLLPQWSFQLPFSGSTHYLAGPAGNNQAYRLLIPGIRIIKQWKVNGISVDGMPVVAQSYNDPLLRESNILNVDSTRDISQVTLHKEFGWSAALLYHQRVLSRWQVAGGIQFNYWQQQLVNKLNYHYPKPWLSPTPDTTEVLLTETIHRRQWKIPAEVYYDAPRWQAGLRVDIPLNINRNDSLTARVKTPVQLQLMFRYKLLRRRF